VYQRRGRLESKKPWLFPTARAADGVIAPAAARRHNSIMRALAMLVLAAGIAVGLYEYSLKKMPTSDPGTASTQAISLTGVRADLLQIAQAERAYIASNGHCASLDELISSNSLAMSRSERDGYAYSLECSGGDFTVVARHPAAPAGSPIRYPTLAVDQTMQVHEAN
jgi:hypothetical protein